MLAPFAMGELSMDNKAKPGHPSEEVDTDKIGDSWRASKIIGTDVKNANNDSVGDVKDLIVDLKSGEVLAAVVSSGGFLGMGDTMSLVPTSDLTYNSEKESFTTTLTKEQLEKAPRHNDKTWNEDRKGMRESLRGFRDAIGGDVSKADNTANNEHDTMDDKLTPGDQGNSESDIKITKDIRTALMDTDMSFNAKNVKIITINGKVMLRGVVENDDERKGIVELAKKHTGDSEPTDEITVKKD